jgi:glycosyltransferase involved in cell wall biosynthesis
VEGYRQSAIAGARLVLVGGPSDETGRLIGEPPPGLERVGHVHQSELVRHYRRASVFVLASIEEGMAMVQAQALACGLPLICTENTGGEDLLQLTSQGVAPVFEEQGVRRYPAGFVIPIRSSAAIARCLNRLSEDRALLLQQSRAARQIHESSLDWQAYADRAIKSYHEIIQRTPRHV